MARKEAPRPLSKRDIDVAIRAVRAFAGRPVSGVEELNAAGQVIAGLEELRDELPTQKPFWKRLGDIFSDDKSEFERTHTLGTEPSIPSDTHWCIRHPAFDENITYNIKDGGFSGVTQDSLGGIKFVKFNSQAGNTHISAAVYNDSDGGKRAKFFICGDVGQNSIGDVIRTIYDTCISGKRDEDVEEEVVIFQHANTDETHILKVTPSQERNFVGFIEVMPVSAEAGSGDSPKQDR